MKKIFFIGCISLFLLSGCKGNSPVEHGAYTKLSLDLTNSTALFISDDVSLIKKVVSKKSLEEDSVSKIYKLNENGAVEEVEIKFIYTDSQGNEHIDTNVSSYKVNQLIHISDKYMIIRFFTEESEEYFLTNLDTGDSYLFNDIKPMPEFIGISDDSKGFYGSVYPQDKYGNIYMRSMDSELCRLVLTNPEQPIFEQVSIPTEKVQYFGVDLEGNIAYAGKNSSFNNILRYVTKDGAVKNLPGVADNKSVFWQGYDGGLFYYNDYIPSEYESHVVSIQPSPFTITPYADADSHIAFSNLISMLQCNSIENKYLFSNNKIFKVDDLEDPMIRAYSSSETLGFTTLLSGHSSDNYLYFVGRDSYNNSSLVRVNPDTFAKEVLIDESYELYDWKVSSDDSITFNALQMSTGKIVVGYVSPSGEITVSDANLSKKVSVLIKL